MTMKFKPVNITVKRKQKVNFLGNRGSISAYIVKGNKIKVASSGKNKTQALKNLKKKLRRLGKG